MSGFDNSVLFVTKNTEGLQARFYYASDLSEEFDLFNSDGSPEGVIAADKGSICSDTTNGALYVKTTDTVNTGWSIITTGSGTVSSVTGTANRISIGGTASVPIVDIAATYVGQTSITTLGTITTGVWNGTTIAVARGGTGSTSFTAGSVVFSNGTILTQDNANFFYDDTNNRLGLGTVTPLDTLHVVGAMELDHTATENDDHAIEIVCNASGFLDVKALDIDYITGAMAAGQDEEAILVNIDETTSTGGIMAGYLVLTTSAGLATVNGYETGINVNPIVHQSGTFVNADYIRNKAVDVTAALASGGAGAITAFVADNDTFTVGEPAAFNEMEVILTTPASGSGIAPTFEYSTGAATFATFSPADGTNGFRNTGSILWDSSMLAGWVAAASGNFEIRITRTRNTLATSPVLDEIQVSSTTEYKWDKNGDVNINSLTLVTDLTVPNGGTGRSSHTEYAVLCGGTTTTAAQQSVVSVGTSGQVLTSNGAGALPTFQTNAGGDVTGPGSSTDNALVRFDGATGKIIQNGVITEDDTGNLSISAAVSGASLSATVANTSNTASATAFYNAQVAGGTASDAYYKAEISGGQAYTWGVDNSDSDAWVLSASATPGTTNVMRVSTAGEINYPLQPAFSTSLSGSILNVTGDGTTYTIVFDAEVFDQNGDLSGSTFTAPVTGRYSLNAQWGMDGLLAGHTTGDLLINTSNKNYFEFTGNPNGIRNGAILRLNGITFADMDAADTSTVSMSISGSTKVVDVTTTTFFSGYLAC